MPSSAKLEIMHQAALSAIALGTGLLVGGAVGTLLRGSPAVPPQQEVMAPPPAGEDDDEDSLLAANANLVSLLQECNRRLSSMGQKQVAQPKAQPTAASPTSVASGRFRGGARREPQATDWERYAKQGAVPYQVPCLRDTPFTPSPRQLDRLGLAPDDASVLRDAYAKSNQRVMAQLKPLCAKVLGSEQLADRVGTSACMNAIVDSARKENPDKMKDALTRVAEVNGGKRVAPAPEQGVEPVEALMLAFTAESKAFESDLAASLGPDEARRIASSRTLCSERGVVRATTDAPRE